MTTPTTVLYLVRHGETESNRLGRLQGSLDIPLSETGRRQVSALAESFRSRTISAAFSSPLVRARQTAELVLAGHDDVPLRILPDLAEMHCGAWEGLDVAERERRYPEEMKQWRQDPWRTAIPGAESLEQVHLRAGRVLQMVLRESIGQSVMPSGHGFFNRVTLLSLLGLPREAFWELKQPNASCHVLRWEGTIPQPDPVTLVSPLPEMDELLVGQPADAS